MADSKPGFAPVLGVSDALRMRLPGDAARPAARRVASCGCVTQASQGVVSRQTLPLAPCHCEQAKGPVANSRRNPEGVTMAS